SNRFRTAADAAINGSSITPSQSAHAPTHCRNARYRRGGSSLLLSRLTCAVGGQSHHRSGKYGRSPKGGSVDHPLQRCSPSRLPMLLVPMADSHLRHAVYIHMLRDQPAPVAQIALEFLPFNSDATNLHVRAVVHHHSPSATVTM